MNQEKHKAVLDALSELIRSELESDDRSRFSSVNRLAVIGQKLILELNPRPEDAHGMGVDALGYGQIMAPNQAIFGGGGFGGDQAQLAREMIALMGPAFGGIAGQNDAKRRESMVVELNALIEAHARFRLDPNETEALNTISKRIDGVLAAMKEEEKNGDEDGLQLVPAVDVRRHQAVENFEHHGGGIDQGALTYGEGRHEGAVPEGGEAGTAPAGLGDAQ